MKSSQTCRWKAVASVVAVLGFAAASFAKPSTSGWFGMYLQGSKLGYSSYSETNSTLDGKPVHVSSSSSVIEAKMLGSNLSMKMFSKSFANAAGKPIEMDFTTTSQDRTQSLSAYFNGKNVKMVITSTGGKTTKVVPLPDGLITDDPISQFTSKGAKAVKSHVVYVLDPTTASFIRTVIVDKGQAKIDVNGQTKSCRWIQIQDPRANEDTYLTADGDVAKIVGPMGIEMLPEPKAKAMSGFGDQKIDLALGSRIVPTLPANAKIDWQHITALKLHVSGKDISSIPTLPGQTAAKDGDGFVVSIEPTNFNIPTGTSIAKAGAGQPEWLKPDTNIPANAPQMVKLARSIIGSSTDVGESARKIQKWVNSIMIPDASIGVLRDAREILKTKRGVCRDYAILTVTLCRAAGIPAKLASGLVSWDGDFYYHAWGLFYDGSKWVGLDSVAPDAQMCASHITLAYGTFAQAFTFPVLSSPEITVISYK